MFRPNRIGTPTIHVTADGASTSSFAPATSAFTAAEINGNVINTTPLTDFGESAISWNAAAATTAANVKFAILHQITVPPPIQGDVVGIEINASLIIRVPQDCMIIPVFCKLDAAGAGQLNGVNSTGEPTYHSTPSPAVAASTETTRSLTYKNQIIVRDTAGLFGTYAHGFLLYMLTALNTTWFKMDASVRQLNDQQNIGYRDTLR